MVVLLQNIYPKHKEHVLLLASGIYNPKLLVSQGPNIEICNTISSSEGDWTLCPNLPCPEKLTFHETAHFLRFFYSPGIQPTTK